MALHTRRDFLVASALTAGSFFVSSVLTGCSSDSSSNTPSGTFNHGVASGDPLKNSVILWTRVTPKDNVDVLNIILEVAADENFEHLIGEAKSAPVKKSQDFTLKVDFQGLTAGTTYFYRFKSGNEISPVGRTKTLPEGSINQVKFAVFSCANYPNGHFNAYSEAAKITDLDATLHLGDYIYEYGMFEDDGVTPAYATEHATEYGRVLPEDNNTELLVLDDYRKRYALYHTDAGLQAIHAACPMIAIWDDHEIANDAYKDGAQNHNEGEGDFTARKMAALQAYFEWIPIRPASEGNIETIYRSFVYGDLVNLIMLDTRIIGRAKQLSYANYPELISSGDSSNLTADLMSPDQTILGTPQTSWLQSTLMGQSSTWDVLAQQVLFGHMNLPAELLVLISQLENGGSQELYTQLQTMLSELYTLKLTDPTNARVTTVMPYNLDAWDGYPISRETVLGTALAKNSNFVVLSGDTHNGWANELKMLDENYQPTIPVGVEFATTSITSPGMEVYAGLSDDATAAQFETVITTLIDDLKYFNANNRGFMSVTFSAEKAVAEWIYVDSNASTTYNTLTNRSKKIQVAVGSTILEDA
jgi:alkaline phosphatase D